MIGDNVVVVARERLRGFAIGRRNSVFVLEIVGTCFMDAKHRPTPF